MTERRFDPARPIAVIGAGVMGTKVAWACARSGIETRLFDTEAGKAPESIVRARTWGSDADCESVSAKLHAAVELSATLENVQLAFENVPEKLELKQAVLAELSERVGADAWIGSNASSLLCSPLAEACRRPGDFFCLNFTDPRSQRLVELMGCAKTAPTTIRFAQDWARHIGMIPLHVRKEQMGYSFNRLWRVIKKEVLRQIAEGYSTPEDIDRAWMLTFGTPYGPCGMMDEIGLHSIANVEWAYHRASSDDTDRPPQFLIDMVARNDLGEISGRGFYGHPNPSYRQPGFLEATDDDEIE